MMVNWAQIPEKVDPAVSAGYSTGTPGRGLAERGVGMVYVLGQDGSPDCSLCLLLPLLHQKGGER